MQILRDVPLGPWTTFGVGGRARYLARAESTEEVRAAASWAEQRGLPVAILGGGSNVIVRETGFPGLVLQPALKGIDVDTMRGRAHLRAAAGEPWDDLVAAAVERDLQGVECLSGIPGSVGAAPIQNIGAYGQELRECLAVVEALDTHTGLVTRLSREECAMGYRSSRFKTTDAGRFIVLAVELELEAGALPCVRYAELERALGSSSGPRSLACVRETVLALRRSKGMLWDQVERAPRTAGSFFMNPVLTEAEIASVARRAIARGVITRPNDIPTHRLPGGGMKLPAAWLIERAGFTRGFRRGRVGLSAQHALALEAFEGATADEVLDLGHRIAETVRETFEVVLVREPVILPDQP